MTGEQKQRTKKLRQQGATFSEIAESLDLSINTIKSFCRRNNIFACDTTGNERDKIYEENKECCKQCGRQLEQKEKIKPRQFCCDKCRFDWWNMHRDKMKHNIIHRLECVNCNTIFNSHDKQRKFCGHACYITYRFKGGTSRDKRTV